MDTVELTRRIIEYCTRYAVPPSTFGRGAINDPRLLSDLALGRVLRPRTIVRIQEYMNAQVGARVYAHARVGAHA